MAASPENIDFSATNEEKNPDNSLNVITEIREIILISEKSPARFMIRVSKNVKDCVADTDVVPYSDLTAIL